jgi:cobalt/nickel transport system ATP-binding protein
MKEIVVDVRQVGHVYPDGVKIDITGMEFQVMRGQRVAVLGPNGAGKSTLIQHVLGLLKPSEGSVTVFGKDPFRDFDEIRSRIGALMQNPEEQLIGPTVFDDVAFAPLNLGFSMEETHRRVEAILSALGISHLRDRLPHYLSGGERKKVALAGVLVTGPELLILDEPLAGIDYASRCEFVDFLKRLHSETGMTMISTLHDMEMVHEVADFGYVMRKGGCLEIYGTITELFFEHDLSRYNLAPPATVRIIKELRESGYKVPSTMNEQELAAELIRMLHHR